MFFDNARRTIVWDGIKDKVFLLKYECFKTDKELKQFIKQKAEREGLAEEDVDILVCCMMPGLIKNKVILADPYDSIPAITELLSGSEEELLVGGDLMERIYPYACLLPDVKKRLKGSSLTLYIDKVPSGYDIGYVVFTGVGGNMISTAVLELSAVPPDFEENPFEYLHFFENEKVQELKKGQVIVIDDADKYSFQAIPFVPYQDYKKSVTKRNILNFASLVLYLFTLWQGLGIFSASRDIMMYTVEEAELSRRVSALQRKVEAYKKAIPNTQYVKDYILSRKLEEKLSKLPAYASMVGKRGTVKTYGVKKKKYKRYILLDEEFQGFFPEIVKQFPNAEITREGYILIPLE